MNTPLMSAEFDVKLIAGFDAFQDAAQRAAEGYAAIIKAMDGVLAKFIAAEVAELTQLRRVAYRLLTSLGLYPLTALIWIKRVFQAML